jgi:hypothetical protein
MPARDGIMMDPHAPIITPAEAGRLRRMTLALLRGSTLAPGDRIAAGVNRTGCTLLMPGVNTLERSVYPGFWARDPAWLAEAGLVDSGTVWGWVRLLCRTMNGIQARMMTTGAEVPPFTVPDHVTLEGRPLFFPASARQPDDGQGGGAAGVLPEHDNQYWLTFTASACQHLSGDAALGGRLVETALGRIPLWRACDLAHHALAVEPEGGCCWIDATRRQADWGYSESAVKTGAVVFPSLLRIESCQRLADLLDGCGQAGRASALRAEAARLRPAIIRNFLREADGQSWLLSATGRGRVPDVWASAYAVHRGFLPAEVATRMARTLADGIVRGTTVIDGQIVHVPTDQGGCWPDNPLFRPGRYQNGAGWGYPVGWYVSAVAQVDVQAARTLFTAYLAAMERDWRDDGVGCAWECVNPALDHRQNEGYLTTIALPDAVLCEAGLIPGHAVNLAKEQDRRDGRYGNLR